MTEATKAQEVVEETYLQSPTYNLPGEVVVTIQTGRRYFIDAFKDSLTEEKSMSVEHQKEVLRLVADLIADRDEQTAKISNLTGRLATADAFLEEVRLGAMKTREKIKA